MDSLLFLVPKFKFLSMIIPKYLTFVLNSISVLLILNFDRGNRFGDLLLGDIMACDKYRWQLAFGNGWYEFSLDYYSGVIRKRNYRIFIKFYKVRCENWIKYLKVIVRIEPPNKAKISWAS